MNPQLSSCSFICNVTKIKSESSPDVQFNQCTHEASIVNKINLQMKSEDEDYVMIEQEYKDDLNVGIKDEIDIQYMKYEKKGYKCNKCKFTTPFFSVFQVHGDECNNDSEQSSAENTSIINKVERRTCKVSAGSSHLNEHMRTHTGEKPYKYNVCGKTFSVAKGVKRYMRIHTGEKPFMCKVCSKAFPYSGGLKAHLRTHTGEKTFDCSVCGKSWASANELTKHIVTHAEKKPFNIVTRHFPLNTPSTSLYKANHTEEKPFEPMILTTFVSLNINN